MKLIKYFKEYFLAKISLKLLANLEYYHVFGKFVNWKSPRDINEKIQYLKFYSDISSWIRLADKYAVREYVQECGLGEMLVKLYGKWDKVEDISWESLPSQFVLKVNNGSGDIVVCRNKNELDIQNTTAYFRKLLNKKFGNYNAEPQYESIKPCIIAEELLDCRKQSIKTDTLIDYKIWCFDGKPYCVWCCYDRHKDTVKTATYDLNWNRRNDTDEPHNHYISADIDIPRPKSLDQMLAAASRLSSGFPQVRVDMYEVEGKPYFGEMTFTSAGGFMRFYTKKFLVELGEQVSL